MAGTGKVAAFATQPQQHLQIRFIVRLAFPWYTIEILGQFLRIESKEVAPQHLRDSPQQVGVNRVLLEKTIDIRAVEVDLPREPGHAALLLQKLSLDDLSDGFH